MSSSMVIADSSVQYETKEAAVIVVAIAYVIVMGATVLAAIALCGWRGAKNVAMDWFHGKATFVCR